MGSGNWWRLYSPSKTKRALDAALRFDEEGAGGGSIIHQAMIALTDAQTKTLPTSAVKIVANADANIALISIGSTWVPYGGGVYGNGVGYGNVNAAVQAGISGGASQYYTVYPFANFFESFGTGRHFSGKAEADVLTGILRNGPAVIDGGELYVQASNSGQNFTDGDAGNTLQVTALYLKLNMTSGLYE